MKNVLFIGLGEIGNAIKQIEDEAGNKTYVCEINKKADHKINYDIAHVAIPYTDNFTNIILEYLKNYSIKFVIVHSTIKPNIINNIKAITGVPIVHSPCMGVHPYLYKGIKTFVKIISGDKNDCKIAQTHYNDIGITSTIFNNYNSSELAKLLDTTYYSWNIMFAKYVKLQCDKYGLDFNEIYKITNEIYNEGYIKLDKKNVLRPILIAPSEEGISGHCCIENAILLYELDNDDFVVKSILKLGKKSDLKYKDRVWLYCEYIGKEKTIMQIAKECNVSSTTISNYLNKFDIEKKENKWSEDEKNLLEELSQEMTFKDISDGKFINRSYNSIRIQASKLNIKSPYKPEEMNNSIREKISCKLQKIPYKDFSGFTTDINEYIRNSLKYREWREMVFKRDNYMCQNPNCKYCKNKKGVLLHAHHKLLFSENKDKRLDIDNGITYCADYHIKGGLHKC